MKKEIKKMVKVAENLGWTVDINNDFPLKTMFSFSKFSPYGQDFMVSVLAKTIDEVVIEIGQRCEYFDCSEETYNWLDNSGHGINGAPYDMKEVYEDMESCLKMMEELQFELEELTEEDEV